MLNEFWDVLTRIPGAGILIIDETGVVRFCNPQARAIFYGCDFDPVGQTIAEIEGADFAAERMEAIGRVLETGVPIVIKHIRGGMHTESVIYPMETRIAGRRAILAFTRQGIIQKDESLYGSMTSQFIDLGPLDVLTKRELEVLALLGHGVPQKSVADQLGISHRTVERYRGEIAKKLHVRSIADIARTVQLAGLTFEDSGLERLHRWQQRDRSQV